MGRDNRFAAIRERADQAIEALSTHMASLDRRIADTRACLERLEPHAKVHYRYNRCSARCNCNDGRGHGPYAYASFRDGDGRVRRRYLGKAPQLPEGTVERGVYRRMERELRELRAERDRLWAQIGRALELLESAAHVPNALGGRTNGR
jgi:hypothetical protein